MNTEPYTNSLIQRMFVATADQNYILARLAYFNTFDVEFYWQSLHALEKYFKAILLINGCPAKGYGHDLPRLHDAVITLCPRLVFGPLADPKIENLYWRDSTVEKFLGRLGQYGNSHNRYMTYGYAVMPDDLMKVDQLIWAVRRYCRPLLQTFDLDGEALTVDQVDELRLNPHRWSLSSLLPIEELIKGRRGEELCQVFLRLNTPFAPDVEHEMLDWRTASANPPLAEYFEILEAANATSNAKAAATDVLQWTLDHIEMSGADKAAIRDAIGDYRNSLTGATS